MSTQATPKPPALLRISAFPRGEETWRIDWFGEVDYPNRGERSNQPSAAVWMSPVIAKDWLADDAGLLSANATAPRRDQIRRFVSVGTLVLLRIGDLWRDQCLVAKPRYEVAGFGGLEISSDKMSVVKAGSSFDDGTFLLPMLEHPWHMPSTHSYCAKVELQDGCSLVIPALELVRFYFGSSSALLSKLFFPEFSLDSLCLSSHLNPETRSASVTLAAGIPRASVHDVARVVFDPRALQAASLVSRSCIRAVQARVPIYPQCVFPFHGITDLRAKGKWLSRSGANRKTFLVYELLSCSHKFPYKALHYTLTESEGADKKGVLKSNADRTGKGAAGQLSKPNRLDERDPGKGLDIRLLSIPFVEKFPDLRWKVTRTSADLGAHEEGASASPAASLDGWAIGDRSGGSSVRSVEAVEESRPLRRQNIPAYLLPLHTALRSFSGVGTTVTAGYDDGWTVPATLNAGDDEPIDPDWLLDGVPRRLCVIDLRLGRRRALIAALEGRPMSLLMSVWMPQFESAATLLPLVLSIYKRIWKAEGLETQPKDSGDEPLTSEILVRQLNIFFAGEDDQPLYF